MTRFRLIKRARCDRARRHPRCWPWRGNGESTLFPMRIQTFIYAVMSEEYRLYRRARTDGNYRFYYACAALLAAARHDDPYPRAAATGLFALFGLQAVINIGVNVGLLPPKGMTLPFVSSGGSSLIGIALTLGLGSRPDPASRHQNEL